MWGSARRGARGQCAVAGELHLMLTRFVVAGYRPHPGRRTRGRRRERHRLGDCLPGRDRRAFRQAGRRGERGSEWRLRLLDRDRRTADVGDREGAGGGGPDQGRAEVNRLARELEEPRCSRGGRQADAGLAAGRFETDRVPVGSELAGRGRVERDVDRDAVAGAIVVLPGGAPGPNGAPGNSTPWIVSAGRRRC